MRKGLAVAVGLTALVAGGAVLSASHFDRETYAVIVTDKERIVGSGGDSSKYLVFGKLQNGQTRVFENTDSTLECFFGGCKWNSSDYQGKIEVGKTYNIDTYGWRLGFLSWYENIVGVDEVKSKQ